MEYPYRGIIGDPWKLIANPTGCNLLIGRQPNYSKGMLICENPFYTMYAINSDRPDEFSMYGFLRQFDHVADTQDRKVTYYYTTNPKDATEYIYEYLNFYMGYDATAMLNMVKTHNDNGYFDYLGIDNPYYGDIFYQTSKMVVDKYLPDYVIDGCRRAYSSNPKSSQISFDKYLVNVFDNNAFVGRDFGNPGLFQMAAEHQSIRVTCDKACWQEHIVPVCFFFSLWTLMLGVLLNVDRWGECTFGYFKLY